MTTFYLDYEGGSDAAAGTSFALRWKTITSGASNARILPGDTIRIMASPDQSAVGNATWTCGPRPAQVSGVTGTSATPMVCTKTGHGLVAGDTIAFTFATTGQAMVKGVWRVGTVAGNDFTLLNEDGTNSVGGGGAAMTGGFYYPINCMVVMLAAPLTANVALCGNSPPAWTASANVTAATLTSDYKEGAGCAQLAVAAAFTTGLAAYFATGTLDLSAYSQLSFWVKQTSGTVAAVGTISLKLCSDTAGAVAVNTVNLPQFGGIGQWMPVTVDTGGALGAAIQSIALYINSDVGAQTFLFDNVIACKAPSGADSLNLTSLIGKNSGTETWWGIQSINGRRVVLDGDVNMFIANATTQRGYYGTSETVATYKRETIKTTAASGFSTQVQQVQNGGNDTSSMITFSGGWDRTSMSAQTGETWFDGGNGYGTGIHNGNRAFVAMDKISFARYYTGILPLSDWSLGTHRFSSMTSYGMDSSSFQRVLATRLHCVASGNGFSFGLLAVLQAVEASSCAQLGYQVMSGPVWNGTVVTNNNTNGLLMANGSIADCTARANSTTGLTLNGLVRINHVVIDSNAFGINMSSGDVQILGGSSAGNGVSFANISGSSLLTLRNMTISDTTKVAANLWNGWQVRSEKEGGVAGVNKIYTDGGTIVSQTAQVHGSAPVGWQFSPTLVTRNTTYPLTMPLAQIAVGANTLVTVTVWMRRDNTGLSMRLVCKGGQLTGVDADVVANLTGSANAWVQVTITFTPTEAGVVEVEAQVFGGTTFNGYVSDLAVSQA